MDNPARSLQRRGAHLVKRGEPTLLRAVALEWMKSFDEEKVAEAFDISPRAVARIIARPDITEYLKQRLIPLQDIAEIGSRRLLEEALKTAFDPEAEWKERVENRKLIAKALLPEIKKISVEHNHYIRAPARAKSIEEWTQSIEEIPLIQGRVIDE